MQQVPYTIILRHENEGRVHYVAKEGTLPPDTRQALDMAQAQYEKDGAQIVGILKGNFVHNWKSRDG